MGNAGQANYSAGKAGVVGLTKTLAKEWGQFKINVNAVAFGFIETRLTAVQGRRATRWRSTARRSSSASPSRCAAMASMLIPLGRPGTPEEAAGGVFFLCSPWSQLRPRPGAQHHRRPVHRDDDLMPTPADIAVVREEDLEDLLPLDAGLLRLLRGGAERRRRCWRCARALIADPEREGVQLIARDGRRRARVGFATVFWTWQTLERGARRGDERPLRAPEHARGTGLADALIAALRASGARARRARS